MIHTLGERITSIHSEIKGSCANLSRMSVAIYDTETDTLHTFLHSTDGDSPLEHYQCRLSDVPSLQTLARSGECRVIDDMSVLATSNATHSRELLKAGYRSSYTVPLYSQDTFVGFLFFDSTELAVFTQPVQIHLGLYAELLGAVISNDINPLRTLKGAVKTAREFSKHHDEETSAHLSRMAHYTRMIAADLADNHGLSDETVEYLFQFAPLHDVGKVAVPDNILLKPSALSSDEIAVMRGHVPKGVEIIDVMIREFGLDGVHHVDMLRNVIAHHHENFDGTGYPFGLAGMDISLEGRIVRAADVFDALASSRPYKTAWTLREALDYMIYKSGKDFDPECVAVLKRRFPEIQEIHDRFRDEAC